MADVKTLEQQVTIHLADLVKDTKIDKNELTIEVLAADLLKVCKILQAHPEFKFEQLIDLCGVDYSKYGVAEWATEETTYTGFSRGVEEEVKTRYTEWNKPRFGVVIHLLSITLNHRIRIRTFAEDEPPTVPTITTIWPVANWFEREAFDLFGIIFEGHADLRRILTDYGFIGFPFRKDFPLIGTVEPRYDASQRRVIYEPVSIKPRTLVPKVIRSDHRYIDKEKSNA